MASSEFQLSTYMRARLETWETDVSTANNTSVVHACIKVWRTNSWSGRTYSSNVTRSITIDGTNVCDWSGEIEHYVSYGEITVAEGYKTVTHNSDGTKSVGVSCSLTDHVSSFYNGSTSLTMGLTTIARASQPSLSASTFNIGDTITIYTNRKSSSFTHTISLTFGSYSYTVGTGVGASVALNTTNIASSLYGQIPNSTSGTGTITCTTYNGSTNIGSKTCSFTAKAVEANVKPTFSNFTYQDTNSTITAITGNNQYLVQGKSSLRVTISSANKATARSSATMSTYNASISGLSASANYTTSDLNINFSQNAFTAGTQALAVRATDSRGFSTTVSKNVNVLAYANPVINASATRLNNFENQTTLKIAGTYSPLTIGGTAKNTVSSVQYRYKAQSTSTWGSWTAMTGLSVTAAGAYTTTDKVLSLDNNTSYDFEVKTTDRLGSSTVSLVVSVGIPIFRIGANDGLLYNKEQPLMPSHIGQVIMSTTLDTAAKVQAIYGGTWEAWGKGKVPVGVDPNDTDFNAPNKSGGSKTVTLTLEQIPQHSHNVVYGPGEEDGVCISYNSSGHRALNVESWQWRTNSTTSKGNNLFADKQGGGKAHSNMPPFQALYLWKRVS